MSALVRHALGLRTARPTENHCGNVYTSISYTSKGLTAARGKEDTLNATKESIKNVALVLWCESDNLK